MKERSNKLEEISVDGYTYKRRNSFLDTFDELDYVRTIKEGEELHLFSNSLYPHSLFILNDYAEGQEYRMGDKDTLRKLCQLCLDRKIPAEKIYKFYEETRGEIEADVPGIGDFFISILEEELQEKTKDEIDEHVRNIRKYLQS